MTLCGDGPPRDRARRIWWVIRPAGRSDRPSPSGAPERLRSLVIYASWTKADPFFRRVFEARRDSAHCRGCGRLCARDRGLSLSRLVGEREHRPAGRARGGRHPAFPAPEIVASRIDAIVDFDRTAELVADQDADSGHLREGRLPDPALFLAGACADDSRRRARDAGARAGIVRRKPMRAEFNDAVLGFIARHS